MNFRKACSFGLCTLLILKGLVKSVPIELSKTALKAPLVEKAVEKVDNATTGQQDVDKENGWRPNRDQHANQRLKVKPTLREHNFMADFYFQKDENSYPKPFDDGAQQSIYANNELVLTNEEDLDMQEEAEIIDVEYRYNIFPKPKFNTDGLHRRVDDQV